MYFSHEYSAYCSQGSQSKPHVHKSVGAGRRGNVKARIPEPPFFVRTQQFWKTEGSRPVLCCNSPSSICNGVCLDRIIINESVYISLSFLQETQLGRRTV